MTPTNSLGALAAIASLSSVTSYLGVPIVPHGRNGTRPRKTGSTITPEAQTRRELARREKARVARRSRKAQRRRA